jgi:DNA-binding cell septation regulator SpoVG
MSELNENTTIDETEEYLGIIIRQTTLTKEEALDRLTFYNNDYIKVIEEFMGMNMNMNERNLKHKENKTLTINQQIYKEIRSIMDDAAMNYYSKKE